jgi:hypothetical protein
MIVDAPWYMPNTFIRRDLQTPTVKEEIRHYSSQYSARLSDHPNNLVVNFKVQPENRRLRRHPPNDLPTILGLSYLQLQSLSFSLQVSFPQATTGLLPSSYRGALLSPLLHVSLIPTSHNRPSAHQLQKSATAPSSTCKSHPHKLQQAYCPSVTEERH